MTAEVAVMNRLAVAVAADSAVTWSMSTSQKIYNAGNKLFALSKHEPVGVMVYGNAELLGLPWETIIKLYRDNLHQRSFETIHDYYVDFLDWIGNNDDLFPPKAQEQYAFRVALQLFEGMRTEIRKRAEQTLNAGGTLDESSFSSLAADAISRQLVLVREGDFSSGFDPAVEALVRYEYRDRFIEAHKKIFETTPLTSESRTQLEELAAAALTRAQSLPGNSGVVVVGFGRREYFPSLRSAHVDTRIAGRLKFQTQESFNVSDEQPSIIIPFAQSDVVEAFISGVDDTYHDFTARYMGAIMEKYAEGLAKLIPLSSENEQQEFRSQAKQIAQQLQDRFKNDATRRIIEQSIKPMMSVVQALPMSELANLAEALVNLTSLRRKVSFDAETVGGPIDVAVISKGDGLIWIQRKHYFRHELNHQFFANYYRHPEGSATDAQ